MSEARRAERNSTPFVGQADSLLSFFSFCRPFSFLSFLPVSRPFGPSGLRAAGALRAARPIRMMPTWPFGPPRQVGTCLRAGMQPTCRPSAHGPTGRFFLRKKYPLRPFGPAGWHFFYEKNTPYGRFWAGFSLSIINFTPQIGWCVSYFSIKSLQFIINY